jgi:hypothetical protein
MPLMPIFDRNPDECFVVGRLLAGYSELEICMMHCVIAIKGDADSIVKALYRARGEKQRIDIADGLARHDFIELGLETQFTTAIGAIHFCRTLRNQLAHCQWWDGERDRIVFTDLETFAKENKKIRSFHDLPRKILDKSLLNAHLGYFEYTQTLFMWLFHELNVLKKTQPRNVYGAFPAPRTRPAPYVRENQYVDPYDAQPKQQ